MDTIDEDLSTSVKSTTSTKSTALMQTFQNDRKRRDNINDRIQELLTLIPQQYFHEYYNSANTNAIGAGSMSGSNSLMDTSSEMAKSKGTGTKDGKPNKGQILTQTVEYITKLQNQVDERNRAEVEKLVKLQKMIKLTQYDPCGDELNLNNTSAEIELSKIGVGPLAHTR